MLSASAQFRQLVADGRVPYPTGTLRLADGTSVTLSGADFAANGVRISEATSATGIFEVGAAVMGSASVTLANYGGKFDSYDFTGAVLTLNVALKRANGTIETIMRGTYGVTQPSSYGNTITLQCEDNLRLFERPYSDVGTNYPATLYQIVSAMCTKCGVTLYTTNFPNRNERVEERPVGDMTCLDMLSYVAQVAGCFARCLPNGRLELAWYDTMAFDSEDYLDGGSFSTTTRPYSDGDAGDGGGFMDGGDAYDGGSLAGGSYERLSAFSQLTNTTDDVVVTGLRVTAQDEVAEDGSVGEAGESCLYGEEGYVLAIEGNPLVPYGGAEAIADRVGPSVVGMRFRPFEAVAVGNPLRQAGDPVEFEDTHHTLRTAFLTQVTWSSSGNGNYSCGAEPPARNSAARYGALTKAMQEARKMVVAEKDARELAMEGLQHAIEHSSGLYYTEEIQEDGSAIRYYHDKPTLGESRIVWRFLAEAFAFSTDGGATYPYGVDVSGTAVLDRIYAVGIDATYLTAGIISDQNGGENYWNLLTGEHRIAASAKIGGKTVQEITSEGITTAIEGVSVSSANLVRNGDFSHGADFWGALNDAVAAESDPERGHVLKVTHRYNNSSYYARPTASSFQHEAGKTYSISFWAKGTSNTQHINVAIKGYTNQRYVQAASLNTTWQRFTGTLEAGMDGDLSFSLTSAGTFWLSDVMLVEGTKPMLTWSPDPRDVCGQLDTLQESMDVVTTLVRQYSDGVLVCKTGQTVGALVNADGSFDVVTVRWSNGVPTAGDVRASFGDVETIIGYRGNYHLIMSKTQFGLELDDYGIKAGFRPATDKYGQQQLVVGEDMGSYSGSGSIAHGTSNEASKAGTYAGGLHAVASGEQAHAEGYYVTASGKKAHVEGDHSEATGEASHAEGYYSNATGKYSHAEGYSSASGQAAHSEGRGIANGNYSHAEGLSPTAHGEACHAEGYSGVARGRASHSEGYGSTAGNDSGSAIGAHAEGYETNATNSGAHSEGRGTTASGSYSHAEGYNTTASGSYSHAGGQNSTARGSTSFVHGSNLDTTSSGQVVFGNYNLVTSGMLIIGNGTSTNRANGLVFNGSSLAITGSYNQLSDRRQKVHEAWLGEDAAEFVRKLRPALFKLVGDEDGESHVGFYAQDVDEADPWDSATVTVSEGMDARYPDLMTLDYTALIAPLVSYCQQLEGRVAELEERISRLEGKL